MKLQLKKESKLLKELKSICGEHRYAIKCADGKCGWDDENLSREDLYRLAARHGGQLYIYIRKTNSIKAVVVY